MKINEENLKNPKMHPLPSKQKFVGKISKIPKLTPFPHKKIS